jgi:hypothetical protein
VVADDFFGGIETHERKELASVQVGGRSLDAGRSVQRRPHSGHQLVIGGNCLAAKFPSVITTLTPGR